MLNQSPFMSRQLDSQIFQSYIDNAYSKISIRRVIYVRFLRWLEKTPIQSIAATCLKCLIFLVLCTAFAAPSFALGMLTASAKWNNYRVPTMLALVAIVWNVKYLIRFLSLLRMKRLKKYGLAQVYNGIPLDEFASYLLTQKAFTTKAISDLGLAQRKWSKIADELEHNKILVRGENNSRVLAEIDRETLVKQLRDGFPLVFDPVSKSWVEKRGSFDQWVLAKERKEAKEEEQRERLERKEDRLRKNIRKLREEENILSNIMSLAQ